MSTFNRCLSWMVRSSIAFAFSINGFNHAVGPLVLLGSCSLRETWTLGRLLPWIHMSILLPEYSSVIIALTDCVHFQVLSRYCRVQVRRWLCVVVHRITHAQSNWRFHFLTILQPLCLSFMYTRFNMPARELRSYQMPKYDRISQLNYFNSNSQQPVIS